MRPVGGTLADRWGGATVLNASFIVVGLLPIILAFQPGIALITVSFLGMAAALGLGNGAVFKMVAETFPRRDWHRDRPCRRGRGLVASSRRS